MKITTEILDKYKKEDSYYMHNAHKRQCCYCNNSGKIYFVDASKKNGFSTVIACVCKEHLKDFHYNELIELSEKDIFYLNIT